MRFITLVLIWIALTAGSRVYADVPFSQKKDVQTFIAMMVSKHQFNQPYLNKIFNDVKIRKQVLTHINKPLEIQPWNTYQMLFVNTSRIQNGVKFWNKYAAALEKAERIYGVPANIIVATIGIETKYGERTGEYRVIDSLSNIAFSDSSRANFFRHELEEYLLLTREQHLDPLKVMGSYAGAIGQPQFMPSSYRAYAVNFSNSGKIDLMNNEVDVIGSIANYYNKAGWEINEPVAIQAAVLGGRYNYIFKKNNFNKPVSVSELIKYGILPQKTVTQDQLKVNVIELKSFYNKEYWLGFHNFTVIKRYNPSDLYAMAVYQLSMYIAELRERLNNG